MTIRYMPKYRIMLLPWTLGHEFQRIELRISFHKTVASAKARLDRIRRSDAMASADIGRLTVRYPIINEKRRQLGRY